tara:strand:- start:64 stop:519 length:456 start_codon:yes stop_codon:yes gene_type:complete
MKHTLSFQKLWEIMYLDDVSKEFTESVQKDMKEMDKFRELSDAKKLDIQRHYIFHTDASFLRSGVFGGFEQLNAMELGVLESIKATTHKGELSLIEEIDSLLEKTFPRNTKFLDELIECKNLSEKHWEEELKRQQELKDIYDRIVGDEEKS